MGGWFTLTNMFLAIGTPLIVWSMWQYGYPLLKSHLWSSNAVVKDSKTSAASGGSGQDDKSQGDENDHDQAGQKTDPGQDGTQEDEEDPVIPIKDPSIFPN